MKAVAWNEWNDSIVASDGPLEEKVLVQEFEPKYPKGGPYAFMSFLDIRDYFALTLQQQISYLKYRGDASPNANSLGMYLETRFKQKEVRQEFIQSMTCACGHSDCFGSEDFFKHQPCRRA